jgi:hypothetical protein
MVSAYKTVGDRVMKLYEIDAALIAALETATAQAEQNDGIVEDAVMGAVEAWEADKATKIEQTASYMLNLSSDAEQLRKAAEDLVARAKTKERTVKWLEGYLSRYAPAGEYGIRKVSYRASKAVEVDDVEQVDPIYLREKITVDADKTAIKKAIESGIEVTGARLVVRQNISIK